MSKKDFIALADAIREHNEEETRLGENGGLLFTELQLSTLASFCRSQNPRFMRDRWLAYIAGECGPNGGEVKRKVKVIGNTQSAYDSANSTSPR